ncbi:MAG TPA: hypothetical protein DDY13_09325 [Cytophagales bacterium]|jgi:hypothetical protein|nr:hypothetical protein [Cytophagales bacterium]
MKDSNEEESAKLNTLFLIGNGFDLAHDLKTRFTDYLKYQLLTIIEREMIVGGEDYNEGNLFEIIENTSKAPVVNESKLLEEIENDKLVKISLKSPLLTLKEDWVDFEYNYFIQLKVKAENLLGGNYYTKDLLEDILKLNEDLETLKNEFEQYLLLKVEGEIKSIGLPFKELFEDYKKMSIDPNSDMMFLNFNYTSTIHRYLELLELPDDAVIYIHGKLNDDTGYNPIRFGIGDEKDDTYKMFEGFNEDCFMENFKSTFYAVNKNYRNLMRFIDTEPFKTVIIGHSCGISDRILLGEILEHENCKEIQIYPRDNDDFHVKVKALLRIFTKKDEFRRKIRSLDRSEHCPQASKK